MAHSAMDVTLADPKGLIRESFRIEGITDAECRSIFTDWALSLQAQLDVAEAMRVCLAEYGADATHPMARVLTEGLTRAGNTPQRRGGRAGRFERDGR